MSAATGSVDNQTIRSPQVLQPAVLTMPFALFYTPGRRPRRSNAYPGVPRFPANWLPLPGSDVATAMQRFLSYDTGPHRTIHFHSVAGSVIDSAGEPIAQLNLGPHRIAVLRAANGYAARWTAGNVEHRISGGPKGLNNFLSMLAELSWP